MKAVGRGRVGRCESIWLFKRVVTSSKSGLWDEVAVTQIGSLTSPLPVCVRYGRLRPALLPAIVTPDSAHYHRTVEDTFTRRAPPVHLALRYEFSLSLYSRGQSLVLSPSRGR